MPKVSVILPTYNREKLLGRAIQNVLDQTFDDFELIIIDDGSIDNTRKVVDSFKDERIIYVRHPENRGAATACNTGIAMAKGRYIAFQDSDDEWVADKLKKQVKAFENSPANVGVVYCSSILVVNGYRHYIRCFEYRTKDRNIFSNIVQRFFVTTQTLMVKRECFEKAGGFDDRLPSLYDCELFLRLSKSYSFIGIDEPLVIRHLQPDSITRSPSKYTRSFSLLVQKYYDEIKEDKKLLSKCYFKLGHCSIIDGNLKEGRNYFRLSLQAKLLAPGVITAYLLSLFGHRVYSTLTQIYRWIRYYITGYPY